ncbi:MAG: septum formation initiator family protein [Proteobacteria bacterium]|nr:septum formation initiator family protein [Pseudomonadota bacterium]MBU1709597.1 septum formation initiator family protein [Pseudomonadota bacterium]
MAQNLTKTEKKRLLLLSTVALIIVALFVIFSPFGILRYTRLQNDLQNITVDNSRLQNEIKGLQEEINRLTNDPSYIEKVAREQYGLIKENEILFDFKKQKIKQ